MKYKSFQTVFTVSKITKVLICTKDFKATLLSAVNATWHLNFNFFLWREVCIKCNEYFQGNFLNIPWTNFLLEGR